MNEERRPRAPFRTAAAKQGHPQDTRSDLDRMFETLVGRQVDGGCNECRAYQEVEQQAPGVWIVVIAHDDDCKFFQKVERARLLRELGPRGAQLALRKSHPSAKKTADTPPEGGAS